MRGVIHKLLPTRNQSRPNVQVIADFDDLIAQPIGFKVFGKVYEIQPVTTETFLKVANALGQVQNLLSERAQGREIKDQEVYDHYFQFITPLCPDMTKDELKKLALPQLNALITLIIQHMTGRTPQTPKPVEAEDAEKKNSKQMS